MGVYDWPKAKVLQFKNVIVDKNKDIYFWVRVYALFAFDAKINENSAWFKA